MKESLIQSIYNPVEFLGVPITLVGGGIIPFIGILLADSLLFKGILLGAMILFFIVTKKLYKTFGHNFETKLISFYLNKGVWLSFE